MAWTWPTGAFFAGIAAALAVMTVLERRWPTRRRKGLLPMATTRGDRFFLGLVCAGYVHLAWLGLFDLPVWIASIVAAVVFAALMRYG